MNADPKPLSIPDAIALLKQHRPQVEDIGALYGLLFHQNALTLDAQAMADAYAGVAAGDPLPRLGLSHHGVQIAAQFEPEDWALVRQPLQAVAAGTLPNVQRFVVESARRILAVEELQQLDAVYGPLLLALLDPTRPPPPPELLRAILDDQDATVSGLRAALREAPLARPFVESLVYAAGLTP